MHSRCQVSWYVNHQSSTRLLSTNRESWRVTWDLFIRNMVFSALPLRVRQKNHKTCVAHMQRFKSSIVAYKLLNAFLIPCANHDSISESQ
jgi:hypothetical protein